MNNLLGNYIKESHDYYVNLTKALSMARIYKNTIVAYLEEIPSAEFAAELVDFFICHKNITWCFCCENSQVKGSYRMETINK